MRTLAIAIVSSLVLGGAAGAHNAYFSVQDSIQMARFSFDKPSVGNPKIDFSPDKKLFAVVTTRGDIKSNKAESTIWLFHTSTVRAYLERSIAAPAPEALLRWMAEPRSFYLGNYEPVISNLQWSPNSQNILFLGQNSRGERQLCEVNVASGTVSTITPAGRDVTDFSFARDYIVYEATPSNQQLPHGRPINRDALDIANVPLVNVLLPQKDDAYFPYNGLWVNRHGQDVRIARDNRAEALRLLNYGPSVISMSPNGYSAVVLAAVEKVPPSWRSYKANSFYPYLRIGGLSDSLAQYSLLNLFTAKASPLVNAPNGQALGYFSTNGAIWSSDGKRVLLLNTFLALNGVSGLQKAKRLRSCLAAVVEIAPKLTTCIAFDRQTAIKGPELVEASFTHADDEVILDFDDDAIDFTRDIADRREERYRFDKGSWILVRTSPSLMMEQAKSTSLPISITVRQSLNDPPVLWASDPVANERKRLWDPNPWLAALKLGKVSELHWSDATGYKWIAGLILPPDYVPGKRYPLVIQNHGFVGDQFVSDGSYTTAFAARPLASAGMIVLQMRDDDDNDSTSEEAPDNIRGYESAIDLLASKGLIDSHRVGIIGFSRTSYYVESALVRDSQRFAAAIIADGVDESYVQYLLFGPNNPYGAGDEEAKYGSAPFGKGLTNWVNNAPGFNLNHVQTPVLIQAIGPLGLLAEWEIYASLQMQRKPVDLIYIADGQHILQRPLDRLASQQGTVDWFRFWLQGYEDPDPAKNVQYARWRLLRALPPGATKS